MLSLSRVKYRGGKKNFRKSALNFSQDVQCWLLLRYHVKARLRSITTMVAGKRSLSTPYASASSSTRSMKASGSLRPVKLSTHLLTTSMADLMSAAVGKTRCAPSIGVASWMISLVLLAGAEILW
uniref:Uncharacterized protein n=1 Tax=Glossina palpalis gambiensis TaxID=67801 RepID=A0A1B0C6E6_9MUSC